MMHEDLATNARRLPQHADEQVLGANINLFECKRALFRQRKDPLRSRRVRTAGVRLSGTLLCGPPLYIRQAMNRSRYLLTIVLVAALLLPYSAASLCAIFNPMTMVSTVSQDSNGPSVGGEAPAYQCDFAECSTAVVAPATSIAAPVGQLPTVARDTMRLLSPVLKDAIPPLTPPPIA